MYKYNYPISWAKTVLFKHNPFILATFSNLWATSWSCAIIKSATSISFTVKNLTAASACISMSIIGPTTAIGTSSPMDGFAEILDRISSVVYIAKMSFQS
jgi:hypothetical protein